ncbi:hypothetical protein RDABS01_000753 [Bienertia sinuspersici]
MLERCSKFRFQDSHHLLKTTPHPCNDTDDEMMLDPLMGREKDIEKIIGLLTSKSNGVSIEGMCGIGKSLLARKIFKENRILQHFSEQSLWVNVANGIFVWDDIKEKIKERVSALSDKKTILIVFDNLQHMGHLEWHKFQRYSHMLRSESAPAIDIRIIITTRNPTISDSTCSDQHKLGLLTNDCCEEVIKKYASYYRTDLEEQHFLDIVAKVAKKCEGLPLGAKMFGIIIGKCKNEHDWYAIENVNWLWQVPGFKTEIFPMILSSSYKDMKPELWRCVAYLSLFPVGHHFDIQDLVHLWVAECFIPYQLTSSFEQIRKDYIDELKRRLIIIHQPSKEEVKLQSFSQELALVASLKTCLRLDQDVLPSYVLVNKPRHLGYSHSPANFSLLEKLSNLRTFISLHDRMKPGVFTDIPPALFQASSQLRVLSLKGSYIQQLQKEIFDHLKQLRYLDISFTRVYNLPKEVLKISGLQFLKIKGCDNLTLPQDFHELTSLIYVDWEKQLLHKDPKPLHQIGKLSKLENLPLFKVGDQEGSHISELKTMDNLQGSIDISNLEKVKNRDDAKEAMLHEKGGLREVSLHWGNEVKDYGFYTTTLENLKPHENVKTLELTKYSAEKLPEWMRDFKFEKLTLTRCTTSIFPALGTLKNVKTLVLNYVHDQAQVSCRKPNDDGISLFTSLESLELRNMTKIQQLIGLQSTDMLRLQNITIVGCTKMERLPSLDHIKTLRSLKIDGSATLSAYVKREHNNNNWLRNVRKEIDGEPFP